MTSEEMEKIYFEVKRHYDGTDHPYYLSELGGFMRRNDISKPDETPLKDYLSNYFKDRLPIVQDPLVRARVAIATPEFKQRVAEQIVGKGQAALGINDVDYRRLPFALLAAFCKAPVEGKDLFFRTMAPFRYDLLSERPSEAYVEISPQFQIPSLLGKDAKQLSEEERQQINTKIGEWAHANSINLQSLYVKQASRDINQKNVSSGGSNALQRLVEAQDPELRSRIRIPLDLANTLMRIP